MNTLLSSLKYAAVATTLSIGAFGVTPAHAAGFSGYYDPTNFTLTNTNSNGFVDTFRAPNSIVLNGTDGLSGAGTLDYTITAAASGTFSFNWDYLTTDVDGPSLDPFSVLINGVETQLSDNGGADSQTGTYTTTVNFGDIIGWRIFSTDNGFGGANVTISNFAAPAAVPEPFTIIGTCIGGAAALRMRSKLKSRG